MMNNNNNNNNIIIINNKHYWSKDVLPFVSMVVMECVNVGLNTLFKAATNRGMNYHVFIVYAYGVAALALSPAPFISHNYRQLPPLNFSIVYKIGLLGLIGCLSQNLGYKGIDYSSPALASALSNLVPTFTFILAVIFRMEKLVLRSSSSQAKIIGTLLSISGAIIVTFYKGPAILMAAPANDLSFNIPQESSSGSNWVIGGLLLSGEYITYPIWYIVQAQIMKEYPDELSVIFYYNVCVAFLAANVALFMESSLDAWKIGLNIALVSVVCSGLFGSFVNNVVHTWVIRVKGPFFVSMFKPLSIAIAVIMGVIFLGDGLFLGSVIGATVLSIGFYTVMWGKAQEEIAEGNEGTNSKSVENEQRVPLLQNKRSGEV